MILLASDYDSTLASHGRVDENTLLALQSFKQAGHPFVLVTGRELPDLMKVFPQYGLCDRIVAENGALLFDPARGCESPLAPPPSEKFVQALRDRGAECLSVGRSIVATVVPFDEDANELIAQLGVSLTVILNKGSVMILPPGVNKRSGLEAAIQDLGYSREQVVGVGDAENDFDLFAACGYGVAVANALPSLKEKAVQITAGRAGAGVSELIHWLLTCDNPSSLWPNALRSMTLPCTGPRSWSAPSPH